MRKRLLFSEPRLWRYVSALVLLAGTTAQRAEPIEAATTPPALPTKVAASFFFSSIENVDSVNETFVADFYLRLGWNDPRLGGLPPEGIDTSTIWQPKVEMVNSRDIEQTWEPYFQFTPPNQPILLCRFHGTFAAPMDLHDFPFDRQVLPVEIESSTFTTKQLVFDYAGNQPKGRSWTAPLVSEKVLGGSVRLPEWKIEAVQVRELDKYYSFVDSSYSRYRIEALVSRRSGFYVWKVIAIEAMIVVLSWVVFFMDVGDLGNRLAVSVTLLLATVAFSYVVSGITPRISYLTLLDWYLLGCFSLIFLSALESVFAHLLRRNGKEAAPDRFDRWSMAAFPILFLILNSLLWAPVLA